MPSSLHIHVQYIQSQQEITNTQTAWWSLSATPIITVWVYVLVFMCECAGIY